ncbi:N-acetyl-D-glucosamine ABC transport system [Vibrio variabilis]|uniref:N-acetyl-D-glucosamine ABC transport system n=1 Tax=Vibrio variabilis TaxID=990271 RepID=A0ABQ0JER0_9VIBR|nr:N-acetyl-D-glucosamine ABC transport system [Vibrio variabilis]
MKIDSKLLGAALIASQAIAGTVLAKTELEVVSWKGAGTEVAEIPTIIKKFEKANPDIKVRLNYMARNDMVTSIPARMQSGDVPDVVMVDNEFILHWGGNGQLEPLNGLPFVERLQPSLLPYSGLDSTIYYAMLEVSGKGVYTNDDLLAKAGIESFPETIDELVVACGKLNDKGILPMLLAANNGGWTPYVYFLALGLTDGDAPDPDRMEKLTSGELKFADDPYMKSAFEGFKKLIDAKCFDPRISAGTDHGLLH